MQTNPMYLPEQENAAQNYGPALSVCHGEDITEQSLNGLEEGRSSPHVPFSCEKTTVQLEHKIQDLPTRLHIYSFSAFPSHQNIPSSQQLLYQQEEPNPAKTLTCHARCKGYASLFPSADLHSPMFLLSPHTWVSLPCLQSATKTSGLQQGTQNHLPN